MTGLWNEMPKILLVLTEKHAKNENSLYYHPGLFFQTKGTLDHVSSHK